MKQNNNRPHFDLYKEFNKRFNETHRDLIAAYPYCFMILENELRNILAERVWIANQNIDRYAKKRKLKERLHYFLYKSVIPFINPKHRKNAYFLFNSFKNLEQNVKNIFIGKNIFPLGGSLQNIKKIFGREDLNLLYLISSDTKISVFFHKIKKHGIDNVLTDSSLLKEMNVHITKLVSYLSKLISKYRIQKIITEIDSAPYYRILCRAAIQSGCPYYVIGHGYFQDRILCSVAPIRADKLFVWTKLQCDQIVHAVDEIDKNKVFMGGYPGIIKNKEQSIIKNKAIRCLFALQPLSKDKMQYDLYRKTVVQYINLMKTYGIIVSVRFHPKNLGNINEFIDNLDVAVSTPFKIYDALDDADFVITTNSSVALQAAFYGKPSFQTEELLECPIEFVEPVNIEKFTKLLNDFQKENWSLAFLQGFQSYKPKPFDVKMLLE